MIEFKAFPKICRLSRDITISEKLDGTNAAVVISDDLQTVAAQSRSRLITTQDDNYGFAKWVQDNREGLLKLGPGHHFGEWWGSGIQRRYNINEKRFSLFNIGRWYKNKPTLILNDKMEECPTCCHVVPVLYSGEFDTTIVDAVLNDLRINGSKASPGFMRPEGIVIYHTAGGFLMKKTIENDDKPKGLGNDI